MVIAETAISPGRSAGRIRSRSITTEVSTSPRGCRGSGTRSRVLIDERVDIFLKSPRSDTRSAGECGENGFTGDEHPLPDGNEFAYGNAVARDDERPALVESAHDASAFVAQLSLSDTPTHRSNCSTRATEGSRVRFRFRRVQASYEIQ